jgi:hypothetical protein
MTDGAQITAAPAAAELALERVILLQAVASPVRWQVLQILATEGPQAVNDLAVLRMAGAVVMVAGTDDDGRKLFHAIPPGCLRDGARGKEIDYGVCVLRL